MFYFSDSGNSLCISSRWSSLGQFGTLVNDQAILAIVAIIAVIVVAVVLAVVAMFAAKRSNC